MPLGRRLDGRPQGRGIRPRNREVRIMAPVDQDEEDEEVDSLANLGITLRAVLEEAERILDDDMAYGISLYPKGGLLLSRVPGRKSWALCIPTSPTNDRIIAYLTAVSAQALLDYLHPLKEGKR